MSPRDAAIAAWLEKPFGTHPFDCMLSAVDAAIAQARREERALWTEAVMTELDGNGQAFAILAAVIGSALADKQEGA